MDSEEGFQPAPLECPLCDQEFDYVEGQREYTCAFCGNRIENIQAQFAYSRGYDAYFTGQQVLIEIPPNRRSSRAYAVQTKETTKLFAEAYSALQEAFQSDLAESQRVKSIEIMASIAHLFMQTSLISPLEANYWTSLMIEQVNRKELDDLNRKINQPISRIFDILARFNWLRRRHQLQIGLTKIKKKINQIEQNINFVTPPRVRNIKTRKISLESFND